MKHPPTTLLVRATPAWEAVWCLLLGGWLLTGCGAKPPAKPAQSGGAAKPATNVVSATATNAPATATNVFLAEFIDDPKSGGKDPFWPKSARRQPPSPTPGPITTTTVTQTSQTPKPVAATNLVLKTILRLQSRQEVMINRTRLTLGQEAMVDVPGGQVKVKLVEIGDRSVKVLVNEEPRELYLRRGNP